MKHFWLAIMILIVLLGVSMLSLHALNTTMDEVLVSLDQAEIEAQRDNFPAAVKQIGICLSAWEEKKGLCGMLLRHDEADDIYFNLWQLEAFCRLEQEEFFGLLAETRAMLEHIKEMERPSYYNFL